MVLRNDTDTTLNDLCKHLPNRLQYHRLHIHIRPPASAYTPPSSTQINATIACSRTGLPERCNMYCNYNKSTSTPKFKFCASTGSRLIIIEPAFCTFRGLERESHYTWYRVATMSCLFQSSILTGIMVARVEFALLPDVITGITQCPRIVPRWTIVLMILTVGRS